MTLVRLSLLASLVVAGVALGCSSSSTPTTPPVADAGSCPTLVPAVTKIGVSAACAECVEAKCPIQACACSKDARCVEVEICAEACVKAGTTPDSCAVTCITDAGGQTTPAGTAAYDLDECFVTTCGSQCAAS